MRKIEVTGKARRGRALRLLSACAKTALMKVWNDLPSCLALVMCVVCSCSKSPQERAQIHYDSGVKQLTAGRQSDAIDAFTTAIQSDPKFSPAYLARGQCHYALKDFKAAEADFSMAIQLEPGDVNAYNGRGASRLNLREVDEAVTDFDKVVELMPDEAVGYRNRAAAHMMAMESEKGVADASKAIEMDGDDAFSYHIRAAGKGSMKDYQAALVDCNKAIELAPTNGEVYAGRGSLRVLMDDFPATEADISRALEISPKSASAYIVRGLMKEKQSDNDGALADFNQAIQLNPETPDPDPYELLGLLQYDLSQWTVALQNLNKSVELRTTENDPHFYIWLIRTQKGEQDAANKELTQFLKSLRTDRAKKWQGSVARYLTGALPENEFFDQATSTAERPSAVRGQKCESFYYAGMKHKIAGDKQGAAELFQKSVDTGDDNAFTYFSAKVELRRR